MPAIIQESGGRKQLEICRKP